MIKLVQRGVAPVEHPEPPAAAEPGLHEPSWDDLRVFLRCVEFGSFRRAAAFLRLSPSTVVRRITRLERQLGTKLFSRLPEGVAPTREGQALIESAKSVEAAIFGVMHTRRIVAAERVAVTVSITEGLGSYWMMPQLVRFQRQNPRVLVKMRCAMENADVLRLEADMSIQLERPQSPNLMVVKLGRLHIYPFASPGYLSTYGTPTSGADMVHHRLVKQVAPQLDEHVWARGLGVEAVDRIVSISTNASTAILYAIENGAGIGGLPTYVGVLNSRIEPVDIGVRHAMDIWLTFHPAVRKDPIKAYLIEWIRKVFDPDRHPWFRDEFVHPTELRRLRQAEDG
jgi:DNA-binding transcriptional LysR family regulator